MGPPRISGHCMVTSNQTLNRPLAPTGTKKKKNKNKKKQNLYQSTNPIVKKAQGNNGSNPGLIKYQCPACKIELLANTPSNATNLLKIHLMVEHRYQKKRSVIEALKQERIIICKRKHHGEHIIMPCEECRIWLCWDSLIDHLQLKKHNMDRLGAIDFMITLKKKIWGQNAPKARDLDDFGRRLPAANEQSSCKNSQRADISTNNAQKDSINSQKSITYLPSSKTNPSLSTPSIASKPIVAMKKSFMSDALSSLKSTGCPPINSAYTTINPTLLREALKDDKAQYEKDFSLTKDVKSNVGEKRKSIVIDDDEDTKVINIQPSNKSKRSEPSKSNSQTLENNSLSTDYKISAPAVDAEYEREKNISNKARIDNKASLRVVITDVKEVNMQKVKVAASCPVCGREFKMKQMKLISHHLVRKHGFKVRQALMEEVKQTRLAKCMKQHGGKHILLPCAVDQCDMWFCSDMSFEQHMRMKHCMSMPDVYKARDELVIKHWGGKKVLVKDILSGISANHKSTLNSNAKSSMEDSMISKSNTEISTRRPTEKSTNTSKSSSSTSTGEEITTEDTRTSKSNAGMSEHITTEHTKTSKCNTGNIIMDSFMKEKTQIEKKNNTDAKQEQHSTQKPTVYGGKANPITIDIDLIENETLSRNKMKSKTKENIKDIENKELFVHKTPSNSVATEIKLDISTKTTSEDLSKLSAPSFEAEKEVGKGNKGFVLNTNESASIISKLFVGSEALETECDRDSTTDVKESFLETVIAEEKELKSSTRENASDQIKSTENGDALFGISCEKVSLKAKRDGDIIMINQSRQEIPEPSIKEEGETSVTNLSCKDSFEVTTQPCQTLEELVQDIQNITTTAKLFIRKAPDLEERLTLICKEVLVDLSEPVRRNFRNKETINP